MNRRRLGLAPLDPPVRAAGCWSDVAAAALAGAAVAWGYRSFFDGEPYLLLGAAVGGAVLSRWPLSLAGLAVAVGLQGGDLVGAGARLLHAAPPTPVTPDLLVGPFLITWLAATATVLLRRRGGLAPLIPVALAFTVVLLLTADRGGTGLPHAAAVLAASLLVLARPAGRRGAVAIGLAVVLAAGVAGALPPSDRLDPRRWLEPRVIRPERLSPLVLLKGQLRQSQPLFTVQTGQGGQRLIRTAALDEFDGALWTSADSFPRTGPDLPADPGVRAGGTITIRVRVSGLAGPYLPSLGRPQRIEGADAGFSAASGVLVSGGKSVRGLRYTLTAGLTPDDPGLAGAPIDPAAPVQLPPGLPEAVRDEARRLTEDQEQPYAKLAALEKHLRSLPYDLDAPPGHSYAAIARTLSDGASEGGYAEQRAAAFAVMARSLGLPARVVVGYRLPPASYRAGAYHVTSREAHAWAEARFAGYGWVPFDPTRIGGDPPLRRAEPVPPRVTPRAGANRHRADTTGRLNQELDRLPAGLVPGLIGGVALLVAAALAGGKAWRRRRRRHAATVAGQVLGAWRETTERLRAYGVPAPRSATALEVGADAVTRLGAGAGPATELAGLATTVVYGREPLGPDASRRAWDLESEIAGGLWRTSGRWPAIRNHLDPRPLLRRQER